ncbi:hypothetical protein OMP38_05355 [Cohnella ginsengisoli]|uniref:Uncharacterized protein n=1 Tax=Cohnella ginsengisoli TaxID=425004 RepID=A0A9X4QL53_9BACL|nr:hypothetical protein [Cohnella ginsengisoli]MDG0790339.1 hypothetical protein [Cohnella ginsengisoli]
MPTTSPPPLALHGHFLQQLAVNDPDHLGEALGLAGPCIRPFLFRHLSSPPHRIRIVIHLL